MRFGALKAFEMGPLDEVDVDFESLPAVLALIGPNGAGKSTVMEMLGGSLSRDCPTRGPLVKLAQSDKSFVETRVSTGDHRYGILHALDGVTGKSEAVVRREDGSLALSDRKVTSFDAFARKTFPSSDLLHATTIRHQKSDGFMELKRTERSVLILRAQGVDRLETIAKKARERAAGLKAAIDVELARLKEIVAGGANVPEAEQALDVARAESARLHTEVEAAKVRHRRLLEEAERARSVAQAFQDRAARVERIEGALRAAKARLADLEGRLANNRALLDRREAIASAQTRAVELDAEFEAIRAEIATHTTAHATHKREAEQHGSRAYAASQRLLSAGARVDAAKKRLARREEIAKAVADVERLTSELDLAEKTAADAHDVVRGLGSRQLLSAEGRIGQLRASLVEIRDTHCAVVAEDTVDLLRDLAKDTIVDDDHAVDTARELPGELARANTSARQTDLVLAGVRSSLDRAKTIAALASTLEAAEVDLAQAEKDAKDAADETERADADRGVAQELTVAANEGRLEADLRLFATTNARAALKTDLEGADRVSQAEARVAELEPQRAQAAADVQAAVEEFEGIPAAVAPPLPPDVAGAAQAVAEADRLHARASMAAENATTALIHTEARARKAAGIQATVDAAHEDLADWIRLAADLGRDGLQAALTDAAAPELTTLANDLLHTCVGPRWTISIETQRTSADGKQTIEACDIRVLDTLSGRDALIETYSGGEKVILGEAVSLALAMMAAREWGSVGSTLLRDESGAALDTENAPAYIAMLRRALEVGGFSQVIFVSHNPATWALADYQLEIKDRKLIAGRRASSTREAA